MRTRKCFDPKVSPWAKEVLCGLNEIKNGLVSSNRPFTLETLCKSLKKLGLPVNNTFKTALANCELPVQKCKLLVQVSKGKYTFTKPKDPIHWIDLQAIYNLHRDLSQQYRKVNVEAEKPEEQKEPETQVEMVQQPDSDIQKAINLLKANGYQVLKPVAVVYEQV